MAERNEGRLSEDRGGSYQNYSEGGVNPPDFDARAKGALEKYSNSLVGYANMEEKEHRVSDEESGKRERAKRANKIYKRVCNDAGIDPCFFNNFGAWSDYVKGRMSEDEFDHKTRKVVEEMSTKTQ